MGSLRSIDIFVLGEAYQPGMYTISALSTLTNATLEFLQRKYNVINKKIIIDLLKVESIKLANERCPYDKHNYPNKNQITT